jgi:hypothetical protein
MKFLQREDIFHPTVQPGTQQLLVDNVCEGFVGGANFHSHNPILDGQLS